METAHANKQSMFPLRVRAVREPRGRAGHLGLRVLWAQESRSSPVTTEMPPMGSLRGWGGRVAELELGLTRIWERDLRGSVGWIRVKGAWNLLS